MTRIYSANIKGLIRLSQVLSLIFFAINFMACTQKESEKITIVWEKEQATGIAIPKALLNDLNGDSISNQLQVRLANNQAEMLGEFSMSGDEVLFKPLLPFSPGLSYQVYCRNGLVGKINIPQADASQAASLQSIYPSQDTLPENLLKIYLQFTAPMREGEALQHISLLNAQKDTVPGVFLDLQPELWNKERTVLTVWLDPGRIKRDLIPNKKMGNPLRKGQQYTINVSNAWKDIRGLPLRTSYNKKFTVGTRDSLSPQPELWSLQLPAKGTLAPLRVNFGEPLDYFLLQETIGIIDMNGKSIPCRIKAGNEETVVELLPGKPWQADNYRLQVASHLEDLAGNNLNRPFDRDIRLHKTSVDKDTFELDFVIR